MEKKAAQLDSVHRELHADAERIVASGEQLANHPRGACARQQLTVIDHAARSILGSLDVVLEGHKKAT